MANISDDDSDHALIRRACFSFHAMGGAAATCALGLIYYAEHPELAVVPGFISLVLHTGGGLLWFWTPDDEAPETKETPAPAPVMIELDGEKIIAFPLGRARMADPAIGPENGSAEVVDLQFMRPAPKHHTETDEIYEQRVRNFDPDYDPSPC